MTSLTEQTIVQKLGEALSAYGLQPGVNAGAQVRLKTTVDGSTGGEFHADGFSLKVGNRRYTDRPSPSAEAMMQEFIHDLVIKCHLDPEKCRDGMGNEAGAGVSLTLPNVAEAVLLPGRDIAVDTVMRGLDTMIAERKREDAAKRLGIAV